MAIWRFLSRVFFFLSTGRKSTAGSASASAKLRDTTNIMARNDLSPREEQHVGGASFPNAENNDPIPDTPPTTTRRRGTKKRVTFDDKEDAPSSPRNPQQVGNLPTPNPTPQIGGNPTPPGGTPQHTPQTSPRRNIRRPSTPPASPTPPIWGRRARPTPIIETTDVKGPHHSDNTSRLATSVLAKLQQPMPYTRTSTAWGPKDTEIQDSNIALLYRVITPPQLAGQKRKHDYFKDPDDTESDDGNAGAGIGSPVRDLSKKRMKIARSNRVHVKPPVDLAHLAPQPIRIDYKSHPLKERSDQWYITVFNKLFQMCDTFVGTYFVVHDLEAGEFYDPWGEIPLSDQFLHWASQVAEEEPGMGGWDPVLRDSRQRRWLVMGILMRIIKVKIFDTDLFGANTEQCELLLGIERALLNREGFQRTELRSHAVRQILGLSPVTQNFYLETASLTAQISLLLKPLANTLYSIPPTHDEPLPNFTDQYQALHNIISMAGYLSLCMRTSASIFYFTDISLGESFDASDQWNLEMEYYTNSKECVVERYKKEWNMWNLSHEAAKKALQLLEDNGTMYTKSTRHLTDQTKCVQSKDYLKATQAKLNIDALMPKPPGQVYRAMTKTSVWPVITRYKAGSDEDDAGEKEGKKIKLQEKNGFRIFQISKAAVVCSFAEVDRSRRVRLEDHVRVKREKRGGTGLVGKVVLGTVAAAVLGVGYVLSIAV